MLTLSDVIIPINTKGRAEKLNIVRRQLALVLVNEENNSFLKHNMGHTKPVEDKR